jgi:Domain of unknown function (DUF4136)
LQLPKLSVDRNSEFFTLKTIVMKTSLKLALVFLLGTAGHRTFAQVTTDFDKTVDFGKYKTYAWLKNDIRVGNNPIYNSQLINRNIRENVEMELAKRDMVLASDTLTPDLLVSFHTYTEKKHTSSGYSGGPAYFAGGFHRAGDTTPTATATGPMLGTAVSVRTTIPRAH